jgi:glycosyltransferase involved in cell wall biosynthesis
VSLRVTLATFDDDPPIGGQGVLVRGMRNALERRGIAMRTVAGRGAHAIPIPAITRRPPLDLSLQLSRRPEILLAEGTELVHVMGGPGGVTLLRKLPVPVVCTANHTYVQAYGRLRPGRAVSLAERRALHRAAAVMCISPSTADAVRALGVPPDRVSVILPGVEADRIQVGAATVERRPRHVLFVGRLEPEKGPLDAVAVMAALCARDGEVAGTVIGGGSLEAQVRAAAAAVPDGRITVLGAVDDETLARAYGSAAVVVMPSAYEGLGLVALEAAVTGAVVVGADVTGLRDAIGEAGVVVPAGDLGAMADAAWDLLRDERRRADLGALGRERVLREHSWDTAAAQVAAVYASALDGR